MGYFLQKLAEEADKNRAAGAAKGLAGAAGLGGLGAAAYFGKQHLNKKEIGRLEGRIRANEKAMEKGLAGIWAGNKQGRDRFKGSRLFEAGENYQKKMEGRKKGFEAAQNVVKENSAKLKALAKKHGKWAIPALLASGALGGGLALSD